MGAKWGKACGWNGRNDAMLLLGVHPYAAPLACLRCGLEEKRAHSMLAVHDNALRMKHAGSEPCVMHAVDSMLSAGTGWASGA